MSFIPHSSSLCLIVLSVVALGFMPGKLCPIIVSSISKGQQQELWDKMVGQLMLPRPPASFRNSIFSCELCELSIQAIKFSHLTESIEHRIRVACRILFDQSLVDHCRRHVADFVANWRHQTAEEICDQMNLCDWQRNLTTTLSSI